MEWENEERILAPKLHTSQNRSTSEVPRAFRRDSLEDSKENVGGGIINKKTGASHISSTLIDASSHVSAGREKMVKDPWEPPSIRTMHQK